MSGCGVGVGKREGGVGGLRGKGICQVGYLVYIF